MLYEKYLTMLCNLLNVSLLHGKNCKMVKRNKNLIKMNFLIKKMITLLIIHKLLNY